jgi:Ca2+-binding EF-hand superfamily protein
MFGGGQIELDANVWTELIMEADKNGDGEISIDEFKAMMKKMFQPR